MRSAVRSVRSDVDVFVDACVRGSRGNITAAYLGAFDAFDGRTRDSVCGRLEKLARECPLSDDTGGSSFVWLDGSRRARRRVASL